MTFNSLKDISTVVWLRCWQKELELIPLFSSLPLWERKLPWRVLQVQKERRTGCSQTDPTFPPDGRCVGRPCPWSWRSAADPRRPPCPRPEVYWTGSPRCWGEDTDQGHRGNIKTSNKTERKVYGSSYYCLMCSLYFYFPSSSDLNCSSLAYSFILFYFFSFLIQTRSFLLSWCC